MEGMKRLFCLIALLGASSAGAEPSRTRPTLERRVVEVTPAAAPNSNVIFLNRCASGCLVRVGSANSINDTWPINQNGTLQPFPYGDGTWSEVLQCVKEVFAPFNVQITDVDPGTANHFEIMIAGSPTNLGFDPNTGGISPFNCNTSVINNSLVFDFAAVWGGDVDEICSTAAQEIAHSFTLDHVIEPSDPMTYFGYNGRRHFVNDQIQCGSDCVNGQGPFGQTCFGANNQSHSCTCTGSQTQNSVQTILTLFGQGTPTPPTISILTPLSGSAVAGGGFAITATITDDVGVARAEARVDGTLVGTLTKGPYAWNAPMTLAKGTHTVEVTAYDIFETQAKRSINIIIGDPCSTASDCPNNTDVCIGGRCVAGPNATGGLGVTCTTGADCASGNCQSSSDGEHHCVEVCEVGQCPSGFGCLENGASGVCWPGYDDGSGGCSAAGGAIGTSFVFALFMFRRRRRRPS